MFSLRVVIYNGKTELCWHVYSRPLLFVIVVINGEEMELWRIEIQTHRRARVCVYIQSVPNRMRMAYLRGLGIILNGKFK
jgi:hypothetical protein